MGIKKNTVEESKQIQPWGADKNSPIGSKKHNSVSSKALESRRHLTLRLMSWLCVQTTGSSTKWGEDRHHHSSYGLVPDPGITLPGPALAVSDEPPRETCSPLKGFRPGMGQAWLQVQVGLLFIMRPWKSYSASSSLGVCAC